MSTADTSTTSLTALPQGLTAIRTRAYIRNALGHHTRDYHIELHNVPETQSCYGYIYNAATPDAADAALYIDTNPATGGYAVLKTVPDSSTDTHSINIRATIDRDTLIYIVDTIVPKL